jgi:hypothetical protein
MKTVCEQMEVLLGNSPKGERDWESALQRLLAHFDSQTATLHRLNGETQTLHLLAQVGLPPQMLDMIQTIPVGKGIAGQVAALGKPVALCNLQTDASGAARPGAKQAGVGGALCVPVRAGATIVGTLGIGTMRPHEYTAAESGALEEAGCFIGRFLGS